MSPPPRGADWTSHIVMTNGETTCLKERTMLKITGALAAKIEANLKNGRTSEMVAHEVVENTTIDLVKVRIPGCISATFKRDDDVGKTFKSVIGEFTADNILNVSGGRIYAGEFVGRLRPSEDVRASFAGQSHNGAAALESMLMASLESSDPVCNEWAARVVEGAQAKPAVAEEPKTPRVKKTKVTGAELVGKVS